MMTSAISTEQSNTKRKNFFLSIKTFLSSNYAAQTQSLPSKLYVIRRIWKKNKFFFLPLGAFIVIIAFLIIFSLGGKNDSPKTILGDVSDKRIKIQNAKFKKDINKTFEFPLKDAKGKEVSKIKYSIDSVELRDEIIVNGKRAYAVKGRTFFIINTTLTNDFNSNIQIRSRDYVRLLLDDSKEKYAPEIHNDPVEIQAISTKKTRLGLPIDDTVKKVTLQIGEIEGSKQNIEIKLK